MKIFKANVNKYLQIFYALFDDTFKGVLWKLGRKSALTPAQTSAHVLRMQDLFLWLEKNMVALSELLLQMVAHLHANSHMDGEWRCASKWGQAE